MPVQGLAEPLDTLEKLSNCQAETGLIVVGLLGQVIPGGGDPVGQPAFEEKRLNQWCSLTRQRVGKQSPNYRHCKEPKPCMHGRPQRSH